MCLERNLHVVEILRLEDMHVLHGGSHHSLRRDATVLREDFLVQRTRIDADTDGDLCGLGFPDHSPDLLLAADVARIQAQCRNALMNGLDGQLIVKMNIGNQWHPDLFDDVAKILRRIHIRHGQAHDIAARRLQRTDLRHRRLGVRRLRIRHRLHGDGSAAADGHGPDMNLPRLLPLDQSTQPPVKTRTRSFFVASSIRSTSSVMPATCR